MRNLLHSLRMMRRCPRGASAVEFAIVFPLLLTMLFGIIVFGSYLAVVHGVQQLAAEAARAAIAGLTNAERTALAQANITTNAPGYVLISPSRLTVARASTDAAGAVFTVELRYDASDMFIFNLPSFVPAPSPTIVRAAVIQRGGY
jgi:Flp pilus assembly protein TadG